MKSPADVRAREVILVAHINQTTYMRKKMRDRALWDIINIKHCTGKYSMGWKIHHNLSIDKIFYINLNADWIPIITLQRDIIKSTSESFSDPIVNSHKKLHNITIFNIWILWLDPKRSPIRKYKTHNPTRPQQKPKRSLKAPFFIQSTYTSPVVGCYGVLFGPR